MKFISGEKKLPSRNEMLDDMWTTMKKHWNKGYRKHYSHFLGSDPRDYYTQLSELAGITNIPEILTSIHQNSSECLKEDPLGFRNYKYVIIDNNNFKRMKDD